MLVENTSLIGAVYLGNNTCKFRVWAPLKNRMVLHLTHPVDRKIEMEKRENGYFEVTLQDVPPGSLYLFMPEGEKGFPDPASHYLPQSVHGPSAVVDHHSFQWNDQQWKGHLFRDTVLYELHVGTFTPEGTFEAIIPRLDDLRELGINALELMPVAQFGGGRNWGYDGVYPYAVQNTYGGPDGLKKLVDACHLKGMAVYLDVVYNHLGPEGNYLSQFGPYMTNRYGTPWGEALNFDHLWSDGVRDYFLQNALYWVEAYHLDGLRLDAIHTIFDIGAHHFLQVLNLELQELQVRLGRAIHTIAESDLNSPRVIDSAEKGGYAFTAQWLDDFHHALYVIIDKKGKDRYKDHWGIEKLAKAYTDGFVHSGEYTEFRKRRYGASSAGISGDKFIVFTDNHDQAGNREKGERLSMLVDLERLKVAAAALLVSPYVPMLFMGEEYADETPFYFFVSHTDPSLIEAVRKGRKEEFGHSQPDEAYIDPGDEATFKASVLAWDKRKEGKHKIMWEWNKTWLKMRRELHCLHSFLKKDIQVVVLENAGLAVHRQSENGRQHLICLLNLEETTLEYTFPQQALQWYKILDSKDPQWTEGVPTEIRCPTEAKGADKIQLPPLSVAVFTASF